MVNYFNMNSSRKLIVEILDRMEKQDSYLNILLPSYFLKHRLDSLDKALLQEISYGVTRFKKKLDWIIGQFLVYKDKQIPLTVRNILRIAVYQFFYLEKIPDYAIVNESVELVKNSSYQGYAGMINAVLRNIIRKSTEIIWPDRVEEPVKYISVFYSFPEWLVERWIKRFGLEMCQDICAASNIRSDLALRVNILKIDMAQFQKILTQFKISFKLSPFLPDIALNVRDFADIANSPIYRKGLFSIQDESSMLASEFLAPLAGETIIDMCSGPGGKTAHIAQIMQSKGTIFALEKNKSRLEMVQKEASRLGIDMIVPVLADSCLLIKEYLEKADKILVDAPCSGTGVIRKKPDIKWKKWGRNYFKELNKTQENLLETAARYLKPGGELLYTTCSLEKEENEDIILRFLKKNTNFVVRESSQFVKEKGLVKYDSSIKEAIQIVPGYSGSNMDGFYIVKMRKVG